MKNKNIEKLISIIHINIYSPTNPNKYGCIIIKLSHIEIDEFERLNKKIIRLENELKISKEEIKNVTQECLQVFTCTIFLS